MKFMILCFILNAVFFVSATFADPTGAVGCPRLSGTFFCPELDSDPAFKMRVQQTRLPNQTVHYQWTYGEGTEKVEYLASVKGAYNPTRKAYGVCKQRGVYISKSATDLSESLRNEINRTGDYQVTTYSGSPVVTCKRIAR